MTDDTEATVHDRAQRVAPFVALYRAAFDRGADDREVVTDLMADLGHYAVEHGAYHREIIDFDSANTGLDVFDLARMHVDEEQAAS